MSESSTVDDSGAREDASEAHARVLDRYRLGRMIGVGGFATVYEAIDERFESPVAVKVLAENHAMNLDIRERFLAEAQLQRSLGGAGVVAVHDLGETPRRQPYTVMALAAGGDLKRRVEALRAKSVAPSSADALIVAEAMARSLAALHAKGIVHRDIKPSNLFIFGASEADSEADSEVDSEASSTASTVADQGPSVLAASETLLLGDLGFAKQLGVVSGLTVAGGTPGFRPPEQERVGQIDYRADVYGASAVLFWMLTGRSAPTDAREAVSSLTKAGVDKPLAQVIANGLSEEPDDRQDTITEWINELRGARRGVRFRPSGRHRRGQRSRWRTVLSAFGFLVALGLGGVVGWFVNEQVGQTMIDEPGLTIESFPDESVHRRGVLGEMTVTIIGPGTMNVGETISFATSVSGAESYAWLGPDGGLYEGRQLFSITGTHDGVATVSVLATRADGRTLTVPAEVTVVGDG